MTEPPDIALGDLGPDLGPPVGHNVTIHANGSEMDTDISVSSADWSTQRKKKHCKRKRKHHRDTNDANGLDSYYGSMEKLSKIDTENTFKQPSKPISSEEPPQGPSKALHTDNNKQLNKGDSTSVPQNTQIGRKEYIPSDVAPYVVHVQRIEVSPNDGTYLHPITFGNFLKNNSFKNIINGSVKRIGRNRCTVSFSTVQDANDFIKNDKLENFKLRAFIPTFNVTRLGIVRGVPAEWSPDEILSNVSLPWGCGQIIKIRRLNFKTQVDGSTVWKPSQSVVFTFDGQVLPKRIYICYNALAVDLYTYPTIQCFNCCRYGHTKPLCRSRPRCYKCAQEHSGENCNVEESCALCVMCSGYHYAISKTCPELNRQKEIKLTMSHNSISYMEACKLHRPVSKPYADVVSTNLTSVNIKNNNVRPPQNTQATSYKKTVYMKPRSPPNVVKGYDKGAHNAIIRDYNMPSTLANGSAFQHQSDDNIENQNMIETIITLLNTLLTKNTVKPSNVAVIVEIITSLIAKNNGPKSSAMELQEYTI